MNFKIRWSAANIYIILISIEPLQNNGHKSLSINLNFKFKFKILVRINWKKISRFLKNFKNMKQKRIKFIFKK